MEESASKPGQGRFERVYPNYSLEAFCKRIASSTSSLFRHERESTCTAVSDTPMSMTSYCYVNYEGTYEVTQ